MAKVYLPNEFDEVSIKCPSCGWSGTGAETNIIDLYGVAKAKEVHCPNCDTFLGNLKKEEPPAGQSADPLSFQLG